MLKLPHKQYALCSREGSSTKVLSTKVMDGYIKIQPVLKSVEAG